MSRLELIEMLGINDATWYRWLAGNPDFRSAVCDELPSGAVERSLFERARGYEYTAQKVLNVNGRAELVEWREHVPPSEQAAKFWLTNRAAQRWRERVEHTGADGAPISFSIRRDEMPPEPLRIARADSSDEDD